MEHDVSIHNCKGNNRDRDRDHDHVGGNTRYYRSILLYTSSPTEVVYQG